MLSIRKIKVLALLLCCFISLSLAETEQKLQSVINADSVISQALGTLSIDSESKFVFDGTSTLHPFTCAITKAVFTVKGKPDIAAAKKTAATDKALLAEIIKKKLLAQFKVEIPAESVKSHDKGMDDNMYKALKTDKFSTITFELSDIDIVKGQGTDKMTAKAKGDLTIAGVKKPIVMDLDITLTDDGMAIVGEENFKMSEYGIEPPVIMFVISVGDPVKVRFNLKVKTK